MKVISLYASLNTSIFVCILLLDTIAQSDLGSNAWHIFASSIFILALVFIFLNFHLNQFLFLSFITPLLFLAMSIVGNSGVMDWGGLDTALSIIVSYLWLTLNPFPLNRLLMKRIVLFYLSCVLMLSLWYYADQLLSGETHGLMSNANFNGNTNAAAMFIFSCLILSLTFVEGSLKWVFVAGFYILILSTASRTGFCVGTILLVGFTFLEDVKRHSFNLKFLFSRKVRRNLLLLMIISGLIYILFPHSFETLRIRLLTTGFDLSSHTVAKLGRSEIWSAAFEISSGSLDTLLFGTGFGRMTSIIGRGMHSSYVWAIISVGWLFLIATFVSILCLLYYHKKNRHYSFILFAVSILIYGAFEAVLFSGLTALWWLFIFLSLYYRSVDVISLGRRELYHQAGGVTC